MKSMDLTHHDNSPSGLLITVCFFCISIFTKLIELNLPEIDSYLLVIVHLVQIIAALCAIIAGFFTIKSAIENNKKQKNDKGN